MIFIGGQKKQQNQQNHLNHDPNNNNNNHDGKNTKHQNSNLKHQNNGQYNNNARTPNRNGSMHPSQQTQQFTTRQRHPTLEKVGLAVAVFAVIFLIAGVGLLVYGFIQGIDKQLFLVVGGGAALALGIVLAIVMIVICCKVMSGPKKNTINTNQNRYQSKR